MRKGSKFSASQQRSRSAFRGRPAPHTSRKGTKKGRIPFPECTLACSGSGPPCGGAVTLFHLLELDVLGLTVVAALLAAGVRLLARIGLCVLLSLLGLLSRIDVLRSGLP